MSALEVFRFEGREVRTVLIDGEPWFVLADVCAVLGLSNPSVTATRVDPDALSHAEVIDSMGRVQSARVVNESGLYEVAIRSDKPDALAFRRWVTREVLPSIRRTGAYVAPESREQLLARAVLEATAAIAEKDEHIAVLTPRAQAWDELADAGTDYAVGDAAKILQRAGVDTGPQRLFEQLRELRWIFRGGDRRWRDYSTAVHDGYLTERAQPPRRDHDTGELVPVAPQVRVTARGLERLRVRLGALALT
ncbi:MULTISPECIES: phage antirepressor [unclassified Microbacterium]|uniref:phage antirepressor n=1 Tax=unclassified Microbacterium TaxID=2609290 RepID=UPI00301009A6